MSIEAREAVSDSELQLLTRKMDDLQAQNSAQEVELTSLIDRMTTSGRVDSLIKAGAKVAFDKLRRYRALQYSNGSEVQ